MKLKPKITVEYQIFSSSDALQKIKYTRKEINDTKINTVKYGVSFETSGQR